LADLPQPDVSLSLHDLVRILAARRWLALAVGLACTTTVLIAGLRVTPLYEAVARLEVSRGRQAVDWAREPETDRIDFALLNTHRDRLLSRPVLRTALDETGRRAEAPYDLAEDPTETLAKRIKVATSRDSWSIEVRLRDESHERAERLLSVLIAAYQRSGRETVSERASGAVRFLRDQVQEARTGLGAAQEAQNAYCDQHGILSADPAQNHLAARLIALTQQRVLVDRELAGVQAKVRLVKQADAAPEAARRDALLCVPDIAADPTVQKQFQALLEAEAAAAALSLQVGPRHPHRLQQDQALVTQREQLLAAIAAARAALLADQDALLTQQASIDALLAGSEKQLNSYRGDLVRLDALTQETATQARMLENLRLRLGEEEVLSRLEAKQVVVTDPPEAGPKPVNVRLMLILAAAVLAGGVGGVGAALVANALDRRLRGAQASELSGLPVLAALPYADGLRPLGAGGDPAHPAELAEAYRTLRAALRLALVPRPEGGGRILVVTSSMSGEGKTTTAARLAAALAATGGRVLLIDGDLRRAGMDQQLALDATRGLSLLLAGEVVGPIASGIERLDVLPAGERPPNPGELLHSPALEAFLTAARTRYDHIICDSAPVALVADVMPLCELADGIILVTRDSFTLRHLLAAALARLAPLQAKLVGVVLNAAKARGGGYGYGYNYAGQDAKPRPVTTTFVRPTTATFAKPATAAEAKPTTAVHAKPKQD